MAGVPKDKQVSGMTKDEIEMEFMMAGYGITKAKKRTNELLISAQIQSDGRTNAAGRMLYFCIYWPLGCEHTKLDRVGPIRYVDARHTILERLDGKENAWLLDAEE